MGKYTSGKINLETFHWLARGVVDNGGWNWIGDREEGKKVGWNS